MRVRIRSAVIIVAVFALLAVALHRLWLPRVGLFLNVPDDLGKADAILIWPGEYVVRMDKAIELYHKGWAPKIVMFSRTDNYFFRIVSRLVGSGLSEPQALVRYFERRGVPAAAVDVREISRSFKIADMLEREHVRSVILVLDSYYMRRVSTQLQGRLRDAPVRIYHVSTTPSYYAPERWWRNRTEINIVFGEYLRLATLPMR